MKSEYLLQAAILVTLASVVLPQLAEPPFSYVASFFLITPWYMLVFFLIFIVLLRGVEEEVGETNYFVVYFVGVLLGNLGLLTLKAPAAAASAPLALVGGGAMGGLLALAGVFIAKHPYDLFPFRLYYPLPAILCLVAIVVLEVLTPDLRLDYLPLLFGVAVGYGLHRAAQKRVQTGGYYSR